jgi:hypothetical protein
MNYGSSSTYCRLAEGMIWFVEEHGVLVIDELSRCSRLLSYPEAAVWDLLVRGFSARRAAMLLHGVFALSESAAEVLVTNCLREWSDAGWLNVSDLEG